MDSFAIALLMSELISILFLIYTVTTVFLHLRLGLFPVPTENVTLVKDYCRSRNSHLTVTSGNDQCTAQIPLQTQLFLC